MSLVGTRPPTVDEWEKCFQTIGEEILAGTLDSIQTTYLFWF